VTALTATNNCSNVAPFEVVDTSVTFFGRVVIADCKTQELAFCAAKLLALGFEFGVKHVSYARANHVGTS